MNATTLPQKPVQELSTFELVAEYNSLTGKSIKKFSSRTAGEKQVEAARKAQPSAVKPKTESPKAKVTPTKEKPASQPKQPSNAKIDADRSRAISESWNDPDIAARRAQRNGVQVDGVDYKSTLASFKSLGLPEQKHGKFRRDLKATNGGKLTFEHEGKKYNFILTK